MSIGRLADRILQRLVPNTEAGACIREDCYCVRRPGIYNCMMLMTNCAGTKCSVIGRSCGPVC